jgi:NAD(P)-dependent dehydrogenase (short-subunit alcohol dehydrogenase family)
MTQKVALVTGASSGIGKAIVLSLAEAGYSVMAAGRDTTRTEELRDQCANVHTWVGDITSADSCVDLVSSCVNQFGRLDLLVNNAGIYHAADAEHTTDDVWLQTIAINLNAPFYLSREAVAYCASKGGIVLMTKAMALDHAHEGIRVNAICPGDVETPMLYAAGAVRGLDADEAVLESARSSPTGKITSANEVAALALFLASDAAAQITGAAIPIDGGNTA